MLPIIDAVVGAAGKVLDKLIPDAAERDRARLGLLQLQQEGQLKEIEQQLSIMLAEAQSPDPWTSRARPTFLYVCYALILASLPMGVLYAVAPAQAQHIAEGFKAWLAAIPEPIVTLMEVGYLGYTGARSVDKWQGGGRR